MSRLFIVRHGNTFEAGETTRRIGVRSDLPLTAEGVAQSERLGVLFAQLGIVFDRASSGSLSRTRASMATILLHQPSGVSVSIDTCLDEIDHGPDECKAEEDVIRRLGAAALTNWDRDGVPPDGWTVDRQWRIDQWRSIFDTKREGNSLLVTSNGAARFALAALRTTQTFLDRKLRTGSYGEIVCLPDGSERLVAWNVRPEAKT